MPNNRVAKTVAEHKAQHPERFCKTRRCLWQTAEIGPNDELILSANPCRRHEVDAWHIPAPLTAETRELAEDTFSRIEGSIAVRDAHARRFGE